VLQIVTAVALNDVEQQQRSADRSGLRARVTRTGDDQIGSRHQIGDSIGESECMEPGLASSSSGQFPGEPAIAARDGQHVDACAGERFGRRRDGT
jgi:hypothetical protein